MRDMLDCGGGGAGGGLGPDDMENYNHGFEIVPNDFPGGGGGRDAGGLGELKVVESPTMRPPRERRPIGEDDLHETSSWTY